MATAARLRPDYVLALHVGLLPIALAAATATRARPALMAMGREVWGDLSATRRRMIRRCSSVMAISDFTAGVLARRTGMARARVATVALPVDRDILALAARTANTERPRMLLSVSRLCASDRYKGHRAIADSLPQVLDICPDVRWHVVGAGDDLDHLKRYCDRLHLSGAVTFEGFVSDARLADLYGHASVHVLPSVTDADARPPIGEGFGLAYAEAAAFGVPSIASTAGGGAADIVQHGRTGITVPESDSRALSAALAQLLTDDDLRTQLGDAARSKVLTEHTPDTFARRLEAILTGSVR